MEQVKGDKKVMLLEAFTKDTGIKLGIETRREYTWWLEQQVVKNLTIPIVSQRSELKPQNSKATWQCDECDKWYEPADKCPHCGFCG